MSYTLWPLPCRSDTAQQRIFTTKSTKDTKKNEKEEQQNHGPHLEQQVLVPLVFLVVNCPAE